MDQMPEESIHILEPHHWVDRHGATFSIMQACIAGLPTNLAAVSVMKMIDEASQKIRQETDQRIGEK